MRERDDEPLIIYNTNPTTRRLSLRVLCLALALHRRIELLSLPLLEVHWFQLDDHALVFKGHLAELREHVIRRDSNDTPRRDVRRLVAYRVRREAMRVALGGDDDELAGLVRQH